MKKRLPFLRKSGTGAVKEIHLGNLGNAYSDLGQVEKAIEYYEKALIDFSGNRGQRSGEGTHLNNLGVAFENMNNYKEALACLLACERYSDRD